MLTSEPRRQVPGIALRRRGVDHPSAPKSGLRDGGARPQLRRLPSAAGPADPVSSDRVSSDRVSSDPLAADPVAAPACPVAAEPVATSNAGSSVPSTGPGLQRTDAQALESHLGANPTRAQSRRRVLIVEDNELNMKLFSDLLTVHGYDVMETREGRSALAIAKAKQPDLILLDIQLPEVSGLDVVKLLKRDIETAKTPVVAVTAYAMRGDEERIRLGGFEAYLSKPISLSEFISTVEKFAGPAVRSEELNA